MFASFFHDRFSVLDSIDSKRDLFVGLDAYDAGRCDQSFSYSAGDDA